VIYAYRKMNRTLLEQAIAAAAGRGHAAGKRETAQMADVWEWEAGHIRVPVQDGRRTALQLKRDYTQKAIELYRRIPGFAKADKALQRSLRSVRELDAQLRGGKR
jgi:hypothetical protein